MVPPVSPKRLTSLPILGWAGAAVLVAAAAVLLVTVIRSAGQRQSLLVVDSKRLYTHCRLVEEALSTDAHELLDPTRKEAAAVRFGLTPYRSVGEVKLCSRRLVDLDALPGCSSARDYGCLVYLAKAARDAVSEVAKEH